MSALSPALSADELVVRMHQQELVAEFSLLALSNPNLQTVMHEACVISARGLKGRMAKVLRHRRATGDFLVVAGIGWRADVVGRATLPSGPDSPAGFALQSGQAVLVNDLAEERRFRLPELLAEHGVQSALNVVIGPVNGDPFGVLEVDSTSRNQFVAADSAFLQAVANVLAAAIARAQTEAAKDALLREKDLLMQEVHHRVKNNLQLVHTMLRAQARGLGPQATRALDEAARRVMTIGAVHHRLYAGATVSRTDAAEFLRALLDEMQPMLAEPDAMDGLRLDVAPVPLSPDSTTTLGIVAVELITNALKHGARPIAIEVQNTERGLLVAVEDNGPGFPANFDPSRGCGFGMRLIGSLANVAPNSIAVDRSVLHGRIAVLITI